MRYYGTSAPQTPGPVLDWGVKGKVNRDIADILG